MKYKIALVPGDGIGVDVVNESVKVLDRIGEVFGHEFKYDQILVGGCSIEEYGIPLTQDAVERIGKCHAILFGAAGGPKWDDLPREKRPESGLTAMRREFGLFANIRPVKNFSMLQKVSPLKANVIEKGIDMVVIRDLTGGIYYHDKGRREGSQGLEGYDTECYSVREIERIAKVSFEIASKRGKRLVSADKANILESSKLWRETVTKLSGQYPDIEFSNMLVDKAAMEMAARPYLFDVVVSTCLFGDILSDVAGGITGSIGMLPSASLNEDGFGLFEPIHGSAPDISGMGIANPIASILSAALMLELRFGLTKEADAIRHSIEWVLDKGYRTQDIYSEGCKKATTSEMGSLIAQNINKQ